MNELVELGATRDAVEEVIEKLLKLFRPSLNPGVSITQWAEAMVVAIGDGHAPADVRAAGDRIIQSWTDAAFPMPNEIRAEIIRQKELREYRAEHALWQRTAEWLDMTTPMPDRAMWRVVMPTKAERDALQAQLDALDRDERYDEAARLFFAQWFKHRKLPEPGKEDRAFKNVPAKYRNTIQAA